MAATEHGPGIRRNWHDLVAGLDLPLLKDTKIEAGSTVRDGQCGRLLRALLSRFRKQLAEVEPVGRASPVGRSARPLSLPSLGMHGLVPPISRCPHPCAPGSSAWLPQGKAFRSVGTECGGSRCRTCPMPGSAGSYRAGPRAPAVPSVVTRCRMEVAVAGERAYAKVADRPEDHDPAR
jgi:hypothetical protein